jgi:hypothetical protein
MARINSDSKMFFKRRQQSIDEIPELTSTKNSNKRINLYGNDEISEFSQEIFNNSYKIRISPIGKISSIRAELIDWMSMISKKLSFNICTLLKSVEIFDRSAEVYNFTLGLNDLHLIAGTSLFMASKLHEVFNYKVEFIRKKIFHSKFEKKDILGTENLLLRKLKFKMPNEFFVNYLSLFLTFLFRNISPIFNDSTYENYKQACFNFSILIYKLIAQNYSIFYSENRLELFLSVIYFALKELDQRNIIPFELVRSNFFNYFRSQTKCSLNKIEKMTQKIGILFHQKVSESNSYIKLEFDEFFESES